MKSERVLRENTRQRSQVCRVCHIQLWHGECWKFGWEEGLGCVETTYREIREYTVPFRAT